MADLGSVGFPLVLFWGVVFGSSVGSVAGCKWCSLLGWLELGGIQEKPAREDAAGPTYLHIPRQIPTCVLMQVLSLIDATSSVGPTFNEVPPQAPLPCPDAPPGEKPDREEPDPSIQ